MTDLPNCLTKESWSSRSTNIAPPVSKSSLYLGHILDFEHILSLEYILGLEHILDAMLTDSPEPLQLAETLTNLCSACV